MKCPSCGLENPTNALRCDCGWDFAAKQKKEPSGSRPVPAVPMTLKQILFSFDGRLGRAAYWIYTLGVLAVFVLLFAGTTALPLESSLGKDTAATIQGLVAIPALAFLFWSSLAIGAKRCHDLNRSGWFQLYNLIPYLGSLIIFIYLGCLRGTQGDNDYGPDPLSRT